MNKKYLYYIAYTIVVLRALSLISGYISHYDFYVAEGLAWQYGKYLVIDVSAAIIFGGVIRELRKVIVKLQARTEQEEQEKNNPK